MAIYWLSYLIFVFVSLIIINVLMSFNLERYKRIFSFFFSTPSDKWQLPVFGLLFFCLINCNCPVSFSFFLSITYLKVIYYIDDKTRVIFKQTNKKTSRYKCCLGKWTNKKKRKHRLLVGRDQCTSGQAN